VYSILKSTVNGKHDYSRSDTTANSPDPNPTDPWLFTDPVAREIYWRRDQLKALEEDICTYVMVDGQWAPEDLELCVRSASAARRLYRSQEQLLVT
jgi:hypothetical protein